MSASQRNKGAAYEREVFAEFSVALGTTYKRHLGQARDGGHDGVVGRLVVECKRRKSLVTLRKWMQQVRAATRLLQVEPNAPRYVPVVVTREDDGESLVILPLKDFIVLTQGQL